MNHFWTPWHLLLLSIIAAVLSLPVIFYILTLHKALRKCAPESRTLEPGLVWLYLIPVVNLAFGFIIVLRMATTLRNEFNRRGLYVADPTPGQAIGIAMAVCSCCGIIPIVGVLALIAHFVLWIIYWLKIAEYSRALDVQIRPEALSAFL